MNFDEFEKLSEGEKEGLSKGVDFLIDMMAEAGDIHMIYLQKYRELTETARKITHKLSDIPYATFMQNTNRALFEQASNLFEQINTLLKDFIKENNLDE